jgi:hypothetical protein
MESAAPLTVDGLLQFDTQDRHFEVVNGKIIEMQPASILHTVIAGSVLNLPHP